MSVETSWGKKRWSNRSVSFYITRHADIPKTFFPWQNSDMLLLTVRTRFDQQQPPAKTLMCSCWLYTLRPETTPCKNSDVSLLTVLQRLGYENFLTVCCSRNSVWTLMPWKSSWSGWRCRFQRNTSDGCYCLVCAVNWDAITNYVSDQNLCLLPVHTALHHMACSITFLGTISQQMPMIHTIVL